MASRRSAAPVDDRELKARQREMWALGDYHKFATEWLWGFGPELVAACGISAGQRVLDVAAGTGNVAIRAAEAGARVVASDLTPENFEAGRREARAHGVELEWVEADAEALPFADGEFDVVTSAVGAIFAPDHQAVADELLRVCRPGGTIGMIAIVPAGPLADFVTILERNSPPALVSAQSLFQWGREEHVQELFGGRVASLQMTRKRFMAGRFTDLELLKAYHPLLIALYLAAEPDRVAALDRELEEATGRWQRASSDGQDVFEGQFLLIVARKQRDPATSV
jgi:ubiquinone/menaquinone biosynthesis C-methylase UbiE